MSDQPQDADPCENAPPIITPPTHDPFPDPVRIRRCLSRLISGNPLYLISAGLLLYGLNALTIDPRFVGAELSLLRFNFCALAAYEGMLVITAIALARRRIWQESVLLIALANVLIIVPFSLISRAAWMSHELAWTMSGIAVLFAAVKLWAFKAFVPALHLPRRALLLGAILLLANAVAPMKIKAMAGEFAQISEWLRTIGFMVVPALAALANFLPRPRDLNSSLPGRRWMPLTLYFCWIAVTACHLLGLAHSSGGKWSYSLVVPTVWVVAWTLCLRLRDFAAEPSQRLRRAILWPPLLIPLLAIDAPQVLLALAALNVCAYAAVFALADRSRLVLAQLLSAIALCLSSAPAAWMEVILPETGRAAWIVLCVIVSFLWLAFVSRDPRLAIVAAGGTVLAALTVFHDSWAAFQLAFCAFLLHSLRWKEPLDTSTSTLRVSVGILWVMQSWSWLREHPEDARVMVYGAVLILSICYLVALWRQGRWFARAIPVCAVAVSACEPWQIVSIELREASRGMIAIIASFLLFGAASLVAFARPGNGAAGPD